MAVNRVLYATQTARIHELTGAAATSTTFAASPSILAVQTASADETIPQEDVLVLGKLGGVARLQKDVATCKATIKAIVNDGLDLYGTDGAGANMAHGAEFWNTGGDFYLGAWLGALEGWSIEGRLMKVEVDSSFAPGSDADGFQMHGICSSIGIDASKGAFPTLDLSFEGVGRLQALNLGTASTLADQHGGKYSILSAVPLTSKDVTTGIANIDNNDTLASLKFSYDMPTETLSRLGGQILGSSSVVRSDNQMFSKPPFKATMVADGQSLTNVAAQFATSCKMTLKGAVGTGSRIEIEAAGLNISTKSFS